MTTMTANPPTYDGKTAEEWRAMAKDSTRRSHESFESCDIDGWRSQWALDTLAREYNLAATLAEANGMWEFEAVFDLDGNFVTDQTISNEWGTSWYIRRPGERPLYLNTSKAKKGERRRKADEAKGYRLGTIRAAGRVKSYGTAGGSVGHYIERDERSEAYEVVDNGTHGTRYEDWNF